MNKYFKYYLVAIENPDRDDLSEFTFEDSDILNVEDQWSVLINDHKQSFRITSVKRVNHIESPNDAFDYRLLAVRMK